MDTIIGRLEIPVCFMKYIGDKYDLIYPTQGYTSDVAIVKSHRGNYVIKRSTGMWFGSMLQREYRVLTRINNLNIRSPYAYEKYEDDKFVWILMEYFRGQTLRKAIQNCSNEQRYRMLVNYGKMLKQIHSKKSEFLNNKECWIEKKLKEAQDNLNEYEVVGTIELLEYLKNNKPSALEEVLIHGDYTIDNVLFYKGEVSGVIDWGSGDVGDPRYDLALATRPKEGIFQNSLDVEYFYEGYGDGRITKEEFYYFQNGGLYDFF